MSLIDTQFRVDERKCVGCGLCQLACPSMLTVVPAGIDFVINALPPMTESLPITVSPPRMEAPE